MKRPSCTRTALGFLSLLLGVFVVWVFSAIVPYEMDEFIHYFPIICRYYPLNALSPICAVVDIDVLGTGLLLPLRSWYYAGSLPALYYYPFFLVWQSPLSARFVGYCFLLLQAVLLHKIYKIRISVLLLGLLVFFPYFFQHIVDTGPAAFHMTSIFLLYWLFLRWSRTQLWRYPILVSVILFLGMWVKLLYVWLLPGIALLLFLSYKDSLEHRERRERLRRFVIQCFVSFALFSLMLLVLLLSVSPSDPQVFPFMRSLGYGYLFSTMELVSLLPDITVFQRLLNPLEATHRIYEVSSIPVLSLLYVFWVYLLPGCVLLALYWHRSSRQYAWRGLLLYGAFLLTLLAAFHVQFSWAMHHIIIAFPFLILSVLEIWRALDQWEVRGRLRAHLRVGMRCWVSMFLVLNVACFLLFPTQPLSPDNDRSSEVVRTLLQDAHLAQNYLYIPIDWGMYFTLGLFGHPDQSVIALSNDDSNREKIAFLERLAEEHQRKLLFVYHRTQTQSDIASIRAVFSLEDCTILDPAAPWQVMLQESDHPDNVCFSG